MSSKDERITLGVRDRRLKEIEDAIQFRKQLLLEKRKELQQKSKINEYLTDVQKSYNKYYEKELKEKALQADALKAIKEHLETIIKADTLLEHELEEAESDKKELEKEITKIEKEIMKYK